MLRSHNLSFISLYFKFTFIITILLFPYLFLMDESEQKFQLSGIFFVILWPETSVFWKTFFFFGGNIITDFSNRSNIIIYLDIFLITGSILKIFVNPVGYNRTVLLADTGKHYQVLTTIISGIKISFSRRMLNRLAKKFRHIFFFFLCYFPPAKIQRTKHNKNWNSWW